MISSNDLAVKAREQKNWSSAAEGWRRRDELLRKGAAPVTKRMIELSRINVGSHVLDIASGTGEPAMSAAKTVGNSGKVIGTDLTEAMLDVAWDKAEKQGLKNITFQCADAESLDFPDASFDAVTMRWGLMFMPNPDVCLAQAYRMLKPHGCISLACWSAPDKNPFVGLLMQVLARYMDVPKAEPRAPGIFAFADPDYLRETMEAAGFPHIEIEEMVIDVLDVADGRAYWQAISDLAAPVMALVKQLDEGARASYVNDVIQLADSFKQGGRLRMKGTTWIASAEKSELGTSY